MSVQTEQASSFYLYLSGYNEDFTIIFVVKYFFIYIHTLQFTVHLIKGHQRILIVKIFIEKINTLKYKGSVNESLIAS